VLVSMLTLRAYAKSPLTKGLGRVLLDKRGLAEGQDLCKRLALSL